MSEMKYLRDRVRYSLPIQVGTSREASLGQGLGKCPSEHWLRWAVSPGGSEGTKEVIFDL
jgi:hypothetical protein